jgi:hypothetical protein
VAGKASKAIADRSVRAAPSAKKARAARKASAASAVLSGRGANLRRKSPAGASIVWPLPPCRCYRTAAKGHRLSCVACSNDFLTR